MAARAQDAWMGAGGNGTTVAPCDLAFAGQAPVVAAVAEQLRLLLLILLLYYR